VKSRPMTMQRNRLFLPKRAEGTDLRKENSSRKGGEGGPSRKIKKGLLLRELAVEKEGNERTSGRVNAIANHINQTNSIAGNRRDGGKLEDFSEVKDHRGTAPGGSSGRPAHLSLLLSLQ